MAAVVVSFRRWLAGVLYAAADRVDVDDPQAQMLGLAVTLNFDPERFCREMKDFEAAIVKGFVSRDDFSRLTGCAADGLTTDADGAAPQ